MDIYQQQIIDQLVSEGYYDKVRDFNGQIRHLFSTRYMELLTLYRADCPVTNAANYFKRLLAMKQTNSAIIVVNNDSRGWAKIIQLKAEYKAKGQRLRLRGRGKNRKARQIAAGLYYNHTGDISIKVCDKIAVYRA